MGLGCGMVVGSVGSTFSPPTLSHILLDPPHHTPPTLNSNTHIPTPQYHIHPVTQPNTPPPLPIHGCSHFYRTSTYPYPLLTHHDFPFPTLPYHRNPSPYSNLPVLPIPSHRCPYSTLPYLHSSHCYAANLRLFCLRYLLYPTHHSPTPLNLIHPRTVIHRYPCLLYPTNQTLYPPRSPIIHKIPHYPLLIKSRPYRTPIHATYHPKNRLLFRSFGSDL